MKELNNNDLMKICGGTSYKILDANGNVLLATDSITNLDKCPEFAKAAKILSIEPGSTLELDPDLVISLCKADRNETLSSHDKANFQRLIAKAFSKGVHFP